MGKRKSRTVDTVDVASASSSKAAKLSSKHKKKDDDKLQLSSIIEYNIDKKEKHTPKKNKSPSNKSEAKLNTSVTSSLGKTNKSEAKLNLSVSSSLGKTNKKNKHKHARNDSLSSDGGIPKSSKKKHQPEKEVKSPVNVEIPGDDSDEEQEVHVEDAVLSEENDELVELMDIPKADLAVIIKGIKDALPDRDTITYKARANKLDWTKIAFGEYSGTRCAKIWAAISKRQRQYRYLSEIVDDALVWLDTPWQSAKKKIKMHPDFPKRPKSAFLLFLDDAKDGIIRETKGAKITEIARIAGQKYNQLSDANKQVYLNRASVSMRKFEVKVEQFYKKHPHLKGEIAHKYRGPKRARTPFNLYLEFLLSKEDHVADKNAYRLVSKETWNIMPAKRKLPWIRNAVAEYKKYLEEVEVYNLQHPNQLVKPIKTILNKGERLIFDKAEGKPLPPPKSAYTLFSMHLIKTEEFVQMAPKERVKAVAAQWNQLSKEQKEEIEKKLHQKQEKYKKDYQTYLMKLPEEERNKALLQMEKLNKIKTEKVKKEKKSKVAEQDLSLQVLPKHWASMSEDNKQSYLIALNKVRDHFETTLNDSLKVDPVPDNTQKDEDEDDENDDESEDSGESESEESDESDSD